MPIHTGTQGALDVFRKDAGGQCENGDAGGVFTGQRTDGPGRVKAIHDRHLYIHEDRGVFPRSGTLKQVHGHLAVLGVDDPQVYVAKQIFKDFSIQSVIFGKEVFGGTGMNVFNPALVARAFVFFAYTPFISGEKVWFADDAVSGATALEQLATSGAMSYSTADAFLGFIPGCVGETSTLAILIGAAILLFTGVASWRTMSFVFIGGLAMGYFFQALGVTTYPAWEHLIVGGFAFGAVFMATDPVTSAQTRTGQYIVGFLTGALAVWSIRPIPKV